MGLIVNEIRFKDKFNVGSVDYFLYNNDELATVEIDFKVERYFITSATEEVDRIILNPSQSLSGEIITDDLILCEDPTCFEEFSVGDTVRVYVSGVDNDYTITEKIDPSKIRVNTTFANTVLVDNDYVANVTPITEVNFFYNLVENNDVATYNSRVDNSKQKVTIKGLDYTNTTPINGSYTGDKSWQNGTLTVQGGNAGSLESQDFTIKQTLRVTPELLIGEFDDLQISNQKPDLYDSSNCARYVYKIETSNDINNPNKLLIGLEDEALGNSGQFDENFNTGLTNYSVDNLVYSKIDATPLTELELTTDEQIITFEVINTVDNPFVSGSTNYEFGFGFAPDSQDGYRNTALAKSKTVYENFLLDYAFGLNNGASVAGDNFGTTQQTILNTTTAFISSSQLDVEVRIKLSQEVVDYLSGQVSRNYKLVYQVQDSSLTRSTSDKVTLLVDLNEMQVDFSDDGMISQSISFLEACVSDIETETTSNLCVKPNDEVLAICDFTLDRNDRLEDEIILKNIEAEIVAIKNNGEEFVLDSAIFDATNTPFVNDIQTFSFNSSRGFATPTDDNRANFKVFRETSLDSSLFYGYRVQFPFVFRWEDWESLPTASNDFFDVNEPNNGLNHNWFRYADNADWSVFF